jgi:hypothetical protein
MQFIQRNSQNINSSIELTKNVTPLHDFCDNCNKHNNITRSLNQSGITQKMANIIQQNLKNQCLINIKTIKSDNFILGPRVNSAKQTIIRETIST